jgi:hypothetical protein
MFLADLDAGDGVDILPGSSAPDQYGLLADSNEIPPSTSETDARRTSILTAQFFLKM